MSYQSNAAEVPVMRKWLLRGLVISLLLHGGLVLFFRTKKLEHFSTLTERLVPRLFNVQRLDVDPKLLEKEEPEPKLAVTKTPEVKPIDLPDEKPSLDKIDETTRLTPATPELTKPIATDKPRVEAANLKSMTDLQKNTANEMEADLKSMSKTLLHDNPKASNRALLHFPENAGLTAANSDAAAMATASGTLDKLLGRGLKKGDAPLSLPGGALFEFGSAELKNDAIVQLRKLGLLIKKNPQVFFSIEGHSDSFGDAETNNRLSLERAESVKSWLVQNMDADPTHIQTLGFGKTQLVVPPAPFDPHNQASIDAEKAHQARNRRVEIVFTFPHAD